MNQNQPVLSDQIRCAGWAGHMGPVVRSIWTGRLICYSCAQPMKTGDLMLGVRVRLPVRAVVQGG